MKRFAALPILLAGTLAFTACNKQAGTSTAPVLPPDASTPTPNKPDPEAAKKQAEDIGKQIVKLKNDLADNLDKAKDEKEAIAKAREFNDALGATVAKMALLQEPDEGVRQVQAKYQAEIKTAQERASKAGAKYNKALVIAFARTEPPPAPLLPGDKAIKPVQQWSGSSENYQGLEPLQQLETLVITDAKTFGQLWSVLRPGEKQPELDFTKVFVIHFENTLGGAHAKIDIHLRDKDDLYQSNEGWGPTEPGYRYAIMVISRAGINSINHRPLPK